MTNAIKFYTASTYQFEGGKVRPLEDCNSMPRNELWIWILNTLLKCPNANHVKIFNDANEVIYTLDSENIFEWYNSTQEYHYTAGEDF